MFMDLYVFVCAYELTAVCAHMGVYMFVCRPIFEHLGAVQVSRQEREAAWKKCRFTEGRGACRRCEGGWGSRISPLQSRHVTGEHLWWRVCIMAGDDETVWAREAVRVSRRDSKRADSTQLERGRERKAEWEIFAERRREAAWWFPIGAQMEFAGNEYFYTDVMYKVMEKKWILRDNRDWKKGGFIILKFHRNTKKWQNITWWHREEKTAGEGCQQRDMPTAPSAP